MFGDRKLILPGKKKKDIDFKLNLGDKVEDILTGFSGIIICRCQWIHNCNTYGVKPTVLKDGVPMDNQYFDEPQLVVVKNKVVKEKRDTGGPCEAVPQTNR